MFDVHEAKPMNSRKNKFVQIALGWEWTANIIKYNRVHKRKRNHLVLIKSMQKFENENRSLHYQQWQKRKYWELPFLLADTIIGSLGDRVGFEFSTVLVFPEIVGVVVFLKDSLGLAREDSLGLVGDFVLTVSVVGSAVEAFVVECVVVSAGVFGPTGLLIGCPVQVPLPNGIFIPLGQRHECDLMLATANRQRWLQLPLFTSHGLVTENLKQSHCVTCHD